MVGSVFFIVLVCVDSVLPPLALALSSPVELGVVGSSVLVVVVEVVGSSVLLVVVEVVGSSVLVVVVEVVGFSVLLAVVEVVVSSGSK